MRAARATFIALGITVAMILTSVGTAGAQAGPPATGADACVGTTKVDLAAARVRLLNTDGERTFGPIGVHVPTGVYTVELASWDRHDETQITQPQEQWRVLANTGWSTPLTADIPDDVDRVVSTFADLAIDAPISSITIVHKGAGIVNSVSPLCVGFTRTGDISAVAPPTDDGDNADDGGETAAPDDTDDTDGTGNEGDTDDPGNEGGTEGDDADGSAISIVRPPEEDDGDTDGTSDSTDGDTDDEAGDDPNADGTSDSIEVEVEGQIELPPALARTGPPLTTIAAIVAAAFVLLGGYAVGWQRRLELVDDPS
ncbi:MAG: hypothetical protein ACR2P0_12545 [Acidimicrobiales bacterium]